VIRKESWPAIAQQLGFIADDNLSRLHFEAAA